MVCLAFNRSIILVSNRSSGVFCPLFMVQTKRMRSEKAMARRRRSRRRLALVDFERQKMPGDLAAVAERRSRLRRAAGGNRRGVSRSDVDEYRRVVRKMVL